MVEQFKQRVLTHANLSESLRGLFNELVYVDVESSNRLVINRVSSVLASKTSEFQKIEIFQTPHFGIVLALDGIIQVAQNDEYIYHELLIHPASLSLPKVTSALVMGGGDGCAARELLRYDEIQQIDLVEIDPDVIELCREHMKPLNQGALADARVNIVVQDGKAYLKENPRKRYDLIVSDLTEPYSLGTPTGELSSHLFSTPFYEFLKGYLRENGILVLQTGGIAQVPEVDKFHVRILEDLRKSFRNVITAYVFIHSFDQLWAITLASDYPYDFVGFQPDEIIAKKGILSLRFYDSISHIRTFHAPRNIRDLLGT